MTRVRFVFFVLLLMAQPVIAQSNAARVAIIPP